MIFRRGAISQFASAGRLRILFTRMPFESAWLIVAAGVFAIGLTKSGFGSGLGLLVVPVITLAMSRIPGFGPDAGLGLMLPLLIVGDVLAVTQNRRQFDRRAIRMLIPGTIVGVIIGGMVLWWFHQKPPQLLAALIKIEIGCECLLLVGLHYWRQIRGVQTHTLKEPLRGTVTGGFAAISSTLAHAAGPIIAMYLLPLRMERRAFVGTSALYFFILNSAKLPAYFASSMFEKTDLRLIAMFLPCVLLGALCGAFLIRRMNDRLFAQIVYAATVVTGVYILVDGIRSL